ncbi:MAG: hypothetical protein LBG82_03865, partial [Clostridiales Family XIII bacterium]|nr:hypothetical protein [Clostridiales Family XIII bacterium]
MPNYGNYFHATTVTIFSENPIFVLNLPLGAAYTPQHALAFIIINFHNLSRCRGFKTEVQHLIPYKCKSIVARKELHLYETVYTYFAVRAN